MEGSPWAQSVFSNWRVVLLLVAVYVVVQYALFKAALWKKKKLPPGVHGCPGLGILPGLAFGKKNLRDVLTDCENAHGQIFRLAMGLQEIYMLQGARAVREALRSPTLTGWPVAARRSLSGDPIDWTRVQDDIRALLEKGDPCSKFRFGEDELDTTASFDGDAKYLRKTNSTILQCCTSMKAGIADRFEQLTRDIDQLVMPETDEEKVRNKTSRSRRFNGPESESSDCIEFAFLPAMLCLCFDHQSRAHGEQTILQGRPETVLAAIRRRLDEDLIDNISRELDALPGQPYWKYGCRLPALMHLIADAYRESHRDLFLIRRCTKDTKLLEFDIPENAVLVFNLKAISDEPDPQNEDSISCWPFELGSRISPFEMAALLQVFFTTIALVRAVR